MLVVAKTVIEDNIKIINKQTGDKYKSDDLFTYLKRAYIQLQKDYPLFKKNDEINSVVDQLEYDTQKEIIDIDSLSIDTEVYTKKKINQFFDLYSSQRCNENIYAIDNNILYISPLPKQVQKINFFYSYAKDIQTIDDEVSIPLLLSEALRFCFLSKFFEEQPRRNKDDYTELDKHYMKLYEKEVVYAKRQLKIRHRGVTSNFQVI